MIVFYPTFQIFLIPIMFIGFAGVTAFPRVTPVDTILPTIVTSMDLPAVAVGFFCAGALAASMSSGDAIVHAAGSVMVKDFYGALRAERLDGYQEARLIRIAVVAIGAIAYYFAVLSSFSLVYLLLLSYGFIAQIFPALIAVFYWRRSTPQGVLAGLLTGCAVVLIWNLVPFLQWQDIHPGIWGVGAHLVALTTVSLATAPMDVEHVSAFVEA
jgi:SSS family solute:Na+ symporter